MLPESIRPAPGNLAGPFGSTGMHLGIPALIVVLSLMFGFYAVVVHASDRLSGRAVLMTIAALYALIVLAPPLISTDIYSYQAYGRMGALYGINPYLFGPHAIAYDSVFPYVGAKWSYIPSVYGPVFTILSYILAPVSIAASIFAYKGIAALATLLTVGLVWNAARVRGVDPVKGAALVGLNPLVVVYGIGGGHNDLLMLALMTSGVWLMIRQRERSAGAMMIVASGVKLTGGIVLPFALAGGAGQPTGRRRRDLVTGAAVAAVTLAVAALALFGSGSLKMLATLNKAQNEGDWHSIPGFIVSRLGFSGTITGVGGVLLGALFVLITALLVWRCYRGKIEWITGAGWATVALLATATALLPWYMAWLLPLAALARDRGLQRTAVAMSGFVLAVNLIGYIPHGNTLLGL